MTFTVYLCALVNHTNSAEIFIGLLSGLGLMLTMVLFLEIWKKKPRWKGVLCLLRYSNVTWFWTAIHIPCLLAWGMAPNEQLSPSNRLFYHYFWWAEDELIMNCSIQTVTCSILGTHYAWISKVKGLFPRLIFGQQLYWNFSPNELLFHISPGVLPGKFAEISTFIHFLASWSIYHPTVQEN